MKHQGFFFFLFAVLLLSCTKPDVNSLARKTEVTFDFKACETDAWVFATLDDVNLRYGFIPSKSQQSFIQEAIDQNPEQVFVMSGTETEAFPALRLCQIPDLPHEVIELSSFELK
ncbi:MAG: hypothetical protein AAF206_03990 [Bacteroidota bacterium]